MALARLLSPTKLASRQHGWVALGVLGALYLGVTLLKIERCLSVAMQAAGDGPELAWPLALGPVPTVAGAKKAWL